MYRVQFIIKEVIDKGSLEPNPPTENPTKEGYIFAGWKRVVDSSGNVTYEPTWIEDPGETALPKVTYVDPKAADTQMILQARKYASQTLADGEASGNSEAPASPSHSGYEFVGWVANQDEFGDWVLVAKYNEKAITPFYYDGQDGSHSDTEYEPSHDGLTFVEWVEIKDENGNVMGYVAKYAADCANPTPTPTPTPTPITRVTPVPTGTTPSGTPVKGTPKTSDEAPVIPLAAIAVAGLAGLVLASRRRMAVAWAPSAGRHGVSAKLAMGSRGRHSALDDALNARR